jgi:hypothetical protein
MEGREPTNESLCLNLLFEVRFYISIQQSCDSFIGLALAEVVSRKSSKLKCSLEAERSIKRRNIKKRERMKSE